MHKFKAKLERIPSQVWNVVFLVPEDIAEIYKEGNRRVICTVNGIVKMHGALMPAGEDRWFVNFNKERQKKLKVGEGSELEIEMCKDESKYGIPMPEEMEELLKIDDEADQYFHQLTIGKQRSLLHIIGKPKNSDTRLKKAIVITEYIKSTRGKLDFKELNQAFKENRGI